MIIFNFFVIYIIHDKIIDWCRRVHKCNFRPSFKTILMMLINMRIQNKIKHEIFDDKNIFRQFLKGNNHEDDSFAQ